MFPNSSAPSLIRSWLTARPVASLKRAGGTGDKQGGTEFEGGGVVGEVLRVRGGGVVGEVLRIRKGGSRRSFTSSRGGSRRGFTNSTGLVGGDEGALGGRHSAGGHSPGGTHRGLLSGGALNGKHSGGNIQRGGTPLQRGGTAPKCPPLATGLLTARRTSGHQNLDPIPMDA